MGDTIATLGIKVTSTGVKETSENLEQVSKSSEKAQKAIDKLLESYKQQEIRAKGGKAGLAEYKLSVLGASEAEKKFADETIKATEKLNEANRAAKKHDSVLGSLISRLSALGAAYFGFQALKGFASDLLETAKLADSYKFSLQAVSSSNEEAAETFEYLTKESERLGLSLVSQEKAFTGFAAAAKQSGMKVEETRSIYTGLMEAMTAIHRSPEEASQALKAFQDMLSKGTIQAEELKKQLGNSLPGAMSYMADATGKTTKDLMKMMEQGILPANEGIKLLSDYLSNKFQTAAESASNSIQGSINKMNNAWYELKKAIVDAMGDNTTGIIRDVTEELKKMAKLLADPSIQQDIKDIAEAIKYLTEKALQASSAIAGIIIGIKNFDPLDFAGITKEQEMLTLGAIAAKKGLVDYNEYAKASNTERNKMVDEGIKKQEEYTYSLIDSAKHSQTASEQATEGIKRITDAQVQANKETFLGAGVSAEQAKQIEKITEKIKEKASEAGKTAIQIQADQLRELGMAEPLVQAQIKLMEATESKNNAVKDGIKASKDAESQEEKRVKFIEDYIAKLEQEADTYKKGKEYTADYVLGLKDATEAQKQRAKAAGAFIDAAKRLDAAEKKNKKNLEDYAALMKKVMPEFERDELSRQQALELTATIFKDKLTPAMMGTAAALHLFDEQSEAIKNINEYFDTKEIDDFTKKTDELKDKLKFEGTSFGNEIADGINNAVISMQKFNDQLDKQTKYQKDIDKLQKEIDTTSNLDLKAKKQKEMDDLAQEGIKGQLSAYRQLFGTTSQLFKENSKERKALHNLEMAFAMAEIAMNLQKTISAAYTAIMIQGTGDPYSAFGRIAAMTALAGGIVAAAGGSLSGGSGSAPSVSASSTQGTGTVMGNPSEKSQSANNALEFMKDIEAKQYNELRDINKGVVDLNNNITNLVTNIVRTGAGTGDMGIKTGVSGGTSTSQDVATKYAISMGTAAFADVAASITKNIPVLGNITAGISNWIDDTTSSISGAIFGGTKKTSILAQGLEVSTAKIGDLLEGASLDIQKFADIKIKKSGGVFGSDKTYLKTITEELTPDEESIKIMFTNVFKNVGETMVAISKELNLGDDKLKEIYAHVFDIGKIDLKGMDTEQINEAISSVINTASDQAVTALFGELIGKYVQVGEALLETAVRVVSERAVVLDILEMTGQGFKDSDIPAYSIEVTQSLLSIAGGIKELQDASATYYDKFFSEEEKQIRLQDQLTESLASIGEPLPALREEFRKIVEQQKLNTVEGQKNYVTLLSLAEGADKYYSVLEQSKQAIENETKAKQDAIAKARQSLEINLLQAEGKTIEALAIQRKLELDAMDESLRPIQERIWALQEQAAAEEKSKQAIAARSTELESLIRGAISAQIAGLQESANAANERVTQASSALDAAFGAEMSKVSSYFDSTIAGLNSSISSAESLASEMRSVQDSFRSTRESMVLAGTEQGVFLKAQTELFASAELAKKGKLTKESASSAIAALGLSSGDKRDFYANSEDYKRDFLKQYAAISALENAAGNQAGTQEALANNFKEELAITESMKNNSIASLQAQLDTIKGTKGVEEKVLSVEEAILQFQEAQNAADGANGLLKTQTTYLESMANSLFGVVSNTATLNELISEYIDINKLPTNALNLPENMTTTSFISGSTGTTTQSTSSDGDLKSEISALRQEMAAANYAIAKNTQATAKVLSKWDYDGMPEVTA